MRVRETNETVRLKQELLYYKTFRSGAYLYRPVRERKRERVRE